MEAALAIVQLEEFLSPAELALRYLLASGCCRAACLADNQVRFTSIQKGINGTVCFEKIYLYLKSKYLCVRAAVHAVM
jgi:hypothetical protein